ncbi:YfdX family protein [Acetobacter sp. TBRC 12305]|uniref:YfdX family protein n=2 Tax=Acetobacter garciniae TaxID=2817435 RepID=A0A939KR77_9PROT|nr:YfdX family protein [Acetobacter garciniae]MBX0344376.1 YfdX family protein [Acetobacter garciniae]
MVAILGGCPGLGQHLGPRPVLAQPVAQTAAQPGARLTAQPNTQPVAQAFARLSRDGGAAFENLTLARRAIFDGDTPSAAPLILAARQALDHAQADKTAFLKAEAELMPTRVGQPPRQIVSGAEQMLWLPIGGELVLDDMQEPTEERLAVLAAANRHLLAGDLARAAEILRVTSVDANYVMTAMPVEKTRQDVARAARLIKTDPYKAGEALREAENAVRYASVAIQAVVTPQDTTATP